MNIHEHQAKNFKDYGAPVSNGVVVLSLDKIKDAILKLIIKICSKDKIHAGGRGKAGGVKLVANINDLENEAKNDGKKTLTHQTDPEGKEVKNILKKHQIFKRVFLFVRQGNIKNCLY